MADTIGNLKRDIQKLLRKVLENEKRTKALEERIEALEKGYVKRS